MERGLYGLQEAGLLLFQTYHKNHSEKLHLKPALNQFLLYTAGIMAQPRPLVFGIKYLQTVHKIDLGTKDFMSLGKEKVKHFKHKPTEIVLEGSNYTFNGALVSK